MVIDSHRPTKHVELGAKRVENFSVNDRPKPIKRTKNGLHCWDGDANTKTTSRRRFVRRLVFPGTMGAEARYIALAGKRKRPSNGFPETTMPSVVLSRYLISGSSRLASS